MIATRFTELVGCRLPIQSAPMGGVASAPELPAAVSEAGGFGMVAAVELPGAVLAQILDAVERPGHPYGVNFLVPFIEDRSAVEMAAERARLVDFFYGEPDPALVELVHAGGALAGWQVGSEEEAKAAVEVGCDVVVAQGIEAGGHVRGQLALLPLLSEVLDAVDVCVVAAGGIASARAVAAVLAAGADAARVGTRLIASEEAAARGAHRSWIEAVIAARGEDTVLTEAFSADWPDAPHRVLRSAIEAAEALSEEMVGEMTIAGMTIPVSRWSATPPNADTTGTVEAMCLYAGQSAGLVGEVKPAGEIVRDLAEGAEVLLARAARA